MRQRKIFRIFLKRGNKKIYPARPQFLDLGDFEEASDHSFFVTVGDTAAINAVNENKALNIPITFLKDGWIVRRMPSGDIQKIKEIKINKAFRSNRKIAKGTILHVNRSSS